MKKGLIDILRYYSTGIGVIYIIYVIFGDSGVDELSPYHYTIITMYFWCLFWMLSSIRSYFIKNKKNSYQKTVIIGNFIIIFGFTLWMYLLISK